jgi:hypothetical protein
LCVRGVTPSCCYMESEDPEQEMNNEEQLGTELHELFVPPERGYGTF